MALPDELLLLILSSLEAPADTATLLRAQLVSKRFRQLARSGTVWRQHLYGWMRSVNELKRVFPQDSALIEYQRRRQLDQQATSLVRKLGNLTSDRRGVVAELAAETLGRDVENCLMALRMSEEESFPEDWISVRYWAHQAVGSVRRATSLRYWASMADGKTDARDPCHFRALAAFDSFIEGDADMTRGMVQSLHDGKWFTLTGADFELPLETLARIAWNSMKKTEVDRLDPALQSHFFWSCFHYETGLPTSTGNAIPRPTYANAIILCATVAGFATKAGDTVTAQVLKVLHSSPIVVLSRPSAPEQPPLYFDLKAEEFYSARELWDKLGGANFTVGEKDLVFGPKRAKQLVDSRAPPKFDTNLLVPASNVFVVLSVAWAIVQALEEPNLRVMGSLQVAFSAATQAIAVLSIVLGPDSSGTTALHVFQHFFWDTTMITSIIASLLNVPSTFDVDLLRASGGDGPVEPNTVTSLHGRVGTVYLHALSGEKIVIVGAAEDSTSGSKSLSGIVLGQTMLGIPLALVETWTPAFVDDAAGLREFASSQRALGRYFLRTRPDGRFEPNARMKLEYPHYEGTVSPLPEVAPAAPST